MRRAPSLLAAAGAGALLTVAVLAGPWRSDGAPPAAAVASSVPDARPGGGLLRAAAGGDGDSWKDTGGRSYRLGLINTPEIGGAREQCWGQQAAAERRRLTADGFTALVYATDRYGRGVSVVTLPDGTNLNVRLARTGFADDRYLAQFRSENPSLASELDVAFAAARRERLGLWGACPSR